MSDISTMSDISSIFVNDVRNFDHRMSEISTTFLFMSDISDIKRYYGRLMSDISDIFVFFFVVMCGGVGVG